MNLDRRFAALVVDFAALGFAQWLFFTVYALVLASNGSVLVLLRL